MENDEIREGGMIVEEVIENEDGSATIRFNMDDYLIPLFIRQGIRAILDEKKAQIVVLPDEEPVNKDAKVIELSDDEAQLFIQMGMLDAIKKGIDEVVEKEEGE